MDEAELRIEVDRLRAKVTRLEKRLDEDRFFARQKLRLEVKRAAGLDVVAALEAQVAELTTALADEAALIDKMVAYISRESRKP